MVPNETQERLGLAVAYSGLSKKDVAERANVEPQVFYDMLSGKRPGTKNLAKLAKVLDVPIEWLMLGTGRAPAWVDFAPVPAMPATALSTRTYLEVVAALKLSKSVAQHKGETTDGIDSALAEVIARQNALPVKRARK
jgi:hypothetical protein